MTYESRLLIILAMSLCIFVAQAQEAPAVPDTKLTPVRNNQLLTGPVQTDRFRTVYLRLGSSNDEGLLYEPTSPKPVALVFEHPGGNNFNAVIGPDMASRGYRVLNVNYHGNQETPARHAAGVSAAIRYLRGLPGVEKVVVSGHSGGGHLIAFYANVAENGPAGCQGPQVLYPCPAEEVTGLEIPDGVVLLDSTLGAFHASSAIDPSFDGDTRQPALDMFAAENGYDAGTGQASYPAEFAKRFHAAQSARNDQIIDQALERLKVIEEGKGRFRDDEPFVIPAASEGGQGIRLYHADLNFVSHTKRAHLLLKADGTAAENIVHSVRPATAGNVQRALGSFDRMAINTTVREFLANYALRTTDDYAITDDDIVGVNWQSSMRSSPASAEGITRPTLIMTMTCHYLIVPGEIIYDHLAAKDKTYVAVEGAVHNFTPCEPEYGDTRKRAFDFVDGWLSAGGRF